MAKIAGRDPSRVIGTKICEVVGIDPKTVTGFTLHVSINDAVRMTIETIPDFDPDKMVEALNATAHEYVIIDVPDDQGEANG